MKITLDVEKEPAESFLKIDCITFFVKGWDSSMNPLPRVKMSISTLNKRVLGESELPLIFSTVLTAVVIVHVFRVPAPDEHTKCPIEMCFAFI